MCVELYQLIVMFNQQNKRQRLNLDELRSAGLVHSTDETYLATNIVNLSTYDGTPQHGLPCTFSQNRTTQIIGNTRRSEIGIASAEIHTKTLPVFQPQVKLGTDVNTLIYEAGYSSVWSGCLINQSTTNARMAILAGDTDTQITTETTAGSPTFMTDVNSTTLSVTDSYGDTFSLRFINEGFPLKHTLLKVLIDFQNSIYGQLFYSTPFKAVCVPSSFEPILLFAPLRLEATPATITGNYVVVKDASGFAVGDRVRLFGTYDSGSTEITNYVTIRAICLYSDLVVSGSMKNPTTDAPNILTSTVLVFDNLAIMAATDIRKGGYVINTRIDSRGGRIEFLTDEFEYRPRTANLVSSGSVSASNNLVVTVPGTLGVGFLRSSGSGAAQNYVKIQVTSTQQPELNGVYRVSTITGGSSPYTLTLVPIGKTIPTVASYTSKTAVLTLASNGYTVDCTAFPGTVVLNKVKAMDAWGFQPTKTLQVCESSYPPKMTQTTHTWKRAYSVEIPLSTYRNLRWVTEDVDVSPTLPVIQQDFGNDSGSSYYNVYDFQQFISQSVNPAFEKMITSVDGSSTLEGLSLNSQLAFVSNAYKQAFFVDPTTIQYNHFTEYGLGDTVIWDGYVYTPTLSSLQGVEPTTTTPQWFRLGDAPNYDDSSSGGKLFFTYNSSSSTTSFICTSYTTTPELVRLAVTPKFKTEPPIFSLDGVTNLMSYTVDTRSFGQTYPYYFQDTSLVDKYRRDIRNYNYFSWGSKNATNTDIADETFIFESNSSFKFIFDNFSCNAVRYVEPTTNGLLVYWTWNQYTDASFLEDRRRFFQTSESLSSSLCPIQSIVILSKSVPVVPTLLSPPTNISDTNTAIANSVGTVGDSDSILGEFYINPGMLSNCRSVIRYNPDEVTYYSLQSTKIFKQFDFIVCYRHRITQRLVPLNLSNYGSVNIKFVFKPT